MLDLVDRGGEVAAVAEDFDERRHVGADRVETEGASDVRVMGAMHGTYTVDCA